MSFERIRKPLKNLFGKDTKQINIPSRDLPPDHRPSIRKVEKTREEEVTEKITYAKMSPKIHSYYADFQENNYYKNFANALIKRCELFGVDFDISERKSRGSYAANCLMKPEFILEKLIENKTPMIWMDCDTDFRMPFIEFNNLIEDIGMATHNGGMSGIKASPLYFNYSAGAFKIIREWVVHCRAAHVKGIPELDHDALKHYVLPKLAGKFSVFLLSKNWEDFVYGKYIFNGNSKVEGKMDTHRKVGVEDHIRALYSQDVKMIYVYFEDKSERTFQVGLNFLEKFSNYSRFTFHFDESLEKRSSVSPAFKKLFTESGGNTHFSSLDFDTHSYSKDQIVISVKDVIDIQKGWDIQIQKNILENQNPLHFLNFDDSGLGRIRIKNNHNIWD